MTDDDRSYYITTTSGAVLGQWRGRDGRDAVARLLRDARCRTRADVTATFGVTQIDLSDGLVASEIVHIDPALLQVADDETAAAADWAIRGAR